MTGEELKDEELMSLFEAARWAPSSGNGQPWLFIYAKRNIEDWNSLFTLLVDSNKRWARIRSVLIVVVSKKEFEYNGKVIPSVTHQFDTGAAWENLALEATSRDLVAHGIAGFEYDKARKDLRYSGWICCSINDCNRKKRSKRESSSGTSGKRNSKRQKTIRRNCNGRAL